MSRQTVIAVIVVALCAAGTAVGQSTSELSYTRLLRKIHLSLLGTVPSKAQYQALLDAPNIAGKEAVIQSTVESALASEAFYENLVRFGRNILGAPEYRHGYAKDGWSGSYALSLSPCPDGTFHQGRLGLFGLPSGFGEEWSLCDDSEALVNEVEPWWAPETIVSTVGWAGAGHIEISNPADPSEVIDCGALLEFVWGMAPPNPPSDTGGPRCGCGPNLLYCARRSSVQGQGLGFDAYYSDLHGQRRALSDEAARLFAHIVVEDRPLTDLVLGTYTVVNQALQHAYVRSARQSGQFSYLDADPWWAEVTDPTAWREVTVSDMNPLYTSQRSVVFDPRIDFGPPPAIPSAGVLTMRGTLGAEERERPRAARWLERLACREFIPAAQKMAFGPFDSDPAVEGKCQVCHAILDPVAMHFKRFSTNGARIGGVGPWQWQELSPSDPDRLRWLEQYLPNSLMTPVTEVDMIANPDARFLDFSPPGTLVLGVAGDGTIGPLGFGKALVASGEFDSCMVRRLYGRFGNVQLSAAVDKSFLDALVADFVAGNRNVRAFIASIVASARFRKGR